MLVKSFTDDLAWEVQGQLVDSYFTKNQKLTQEQMMRIQLGMVDDMAVKIDSVETRLEKIEDTMTIDYGQQRVLAKLVNEAVISHLGGNGFSGI